MTFSISDHHSQQYSIPKIIHYVWLGGGDKNEKIKKCIRSWEQFCPEYQIVEWNEDRIKKINNNFMREAVESKYWAFASDYIRLYALHEFGGIYCDTDLEITASIDEFLKNKFFCCFEVDNFPSTAFLGACKNDLLIKAILNYYQDRHFIVNGRPDLTPNPQIFRHVISSISSKIKYANEYSKVEIRENCVIYPSYYFCKDNKTHKNYAIHHFEGSWLPPQDITETKKLLKLWRFEIIKTKSGPKAKYPPEFDRQTKVILNLQYKNRRMIYFILNNNT